MSEDNVTDTVPDPKASAPDPKASASAPAPAPVPAPAPAPAKCALGRGQPRKGKPKPGELTAAFIQRKSQPRLGAQQPTRGKKGGAQEAEGDKARGSNIEGEGAEEAVAGEIVDVARDGKKNSSVYKVGEEWLLFGELGTDAAGLRKRFRAKCPNHAELAKRPISDVEISTATKSTAKSTSKSASAGKRASTTTATALPAKKAAKSRLSPRLSRCVVWVPLCMFFLC
jgi:hypothetical protein